VDDVPGTTSRNTATELRLTMPQHDNGYAIVHVQVAGEDLTARFLYLPPALRDLPAGFITTVAGIGRYTGHYGPAKDAAIFAGDLDFGPDGLLYTADDNRVSRVRADGVLEPFAGNGQPPEPMTFRDPAPRLEISLRATSFVVENDGDVVISDFDRIWRVDGASGVARVIAGTGVSGFSGDGGPATSAQLNLAHWLTGDRRGTIWFLDFGNNRIRQVAPDGRISTLCGTGVRGLSGDGGPAAAATFNVSNVDFGELAYDPAGRLYFSDDGNHRIRRIDLATGTIDTFVGPAPLGDVRFDGQLRALRVGPGGDLYFNIDTRIVRVSPSGSLVEVWGSVEPTLALSTDGARLSALRVGGILGFAFDSLGNLLYGEEDSNRVMRMNLQTGLLETVISVNGPGAFGEEGPALAAAPFDTQQPEIHVSPAGEITFSGRRIRKIGLDGRLSVVASRGLAMSCCADMPAKEASYITEGIAVDPSGSLYLATYSTVMKVDSAGIIRHVAGGGNPQICGLAGDGGPATNANLCQPWDVAFDRDGNLFIADTNHNRVRRVDARTNILTTIAGSGPINGFEGYNHGSYCGDGGPAIAACLDTPLGVAVNSIGEIVIAEGGRLRRIDGSGTIATLPLSTAWTYPAFDASDNLYVTSESDIYRLTPWGGKELLANGTGLHGFRGDGGPALGALLTIPTSFGFDGEGNLYFADGKRIRAIRYGAVLAPRNAGIRAERTGTAISMTVRDGAGRPASGVRVDFVVPANGASCTPLPSFVITDRNGTATSTCVPNCIPGSYEVIAQPMMASSRASLSFINPSGPCRRHSARH
jgi:sugar lactone lactonase YvrE